MRLFHKAAVVLALTSLGLLADQCQYAHPLPEQAIFTEDGPILQPTPLSTEVLRVLLETDAAKEGLAFAQPSTPSEAAQLFRAGEVHLNGSNSSDLVVIGTGWMSGADNGWFWVVRSARSDPQVVLFAGGNTLELMGTKTRGYRDIRSVFSTASETRDSEYHFDGKQYKLWREKRTENPN